MKEIPLTQGYVTLVDDEDYDFLMQWKWCACVRENGYIRAMRRSKKNNGIRKSIYMHREIMPVPDDKSVDHINGNPLDNRKANLRICTHEQNCCNRVRRKPNPTGYCGVYRSGSKFLAQVMIKGRLTYFGTYDTAELAAKARDVAAIKHFGEFARLNFPKEDYALHGHV